MGWVVVVRLLHLVHLVQDVSRMSKRQQAECAMMMPGLGRAIVLAHVLVLLSRIVGPEQQTKSEQRLLNHGEHKRIKETYLPVPHCSHINDTRTVWALREFDFLIGVRLRAEDRGQSGDECIWT
jgi:hypothetical protein